jgi:hypothetical protein
MADKSATRLCAFSRSAFALAFLLLAGAPVLFAQDATPGPMAPPPEHHVTRVVGVPEPVAPPSLPPTQIIQAFSKKEETYQATRPQFTYHKSIHIQEFGPDGRVSGEYLATYELARTGDGKFYEKAVGPPQTSLQYLSFEPEDAEALTRVPAYPVTTSQLAKYDVRYLNTDKIDEIDCYIFQVSPRTLDRQHPLFDGVIWVDQKYLEVVKTYGKWITDLGAIHPSSLPFDMFETYRENVEGKYWFPDYARADGSFKVKDRDIPVRVIIKWTDFKPFPPMAAPPSAPASPQPQPSSPSPAPKP